MGNYIAVLCEEGRRGLLGTVVSQLRSRGIEIWSKEDLVPGDEWDLIIPEKVRGGRAAVIVGEVKEPDCYLRDEIDLLKKKNIPSRIFSAGNLEEILAWIAQGCPHRK